MNFLKFYINIFNFYINFLKFPHFETYEPCNENYKHSDFVHCKEDVTLLCSKNQKQAKKKKTIAILHHK